jgi:hypothetical protein
MGWTWKSYLRAEQAPGAAAEAQGDSKSQTLGAIVGILCALGLIGWLLARV